MTSTQEIFEAWKRETAEAGRAKGLAEGRAKGRAEGRAEGTARSIVVIYEIHFGAMPPELKAVVEGTEEEAVLLAWLRLVETSSADTFAATVLASRAG